MSRTRRFAGVAILAAFAAGCGPSAEKGTGAPSDPSATDVVLADLFVQVRRRQWLLRFLPRAVAEGIERGDIRLELGGVEREVTVLLADLREFTTLAESRDPAEVLAILNEHFATMAAVVWRHGGMIDKFIGDAVLAVFGVPLTGPDDALRATQAALAMQAELAGLRARLARRSMPPLEMGIALHTGRVVAGHVGTPERLEYTIVGDTVNVAARIEELNKEYGTAILMSEATWRRVGDHVPARPLGERVFARPPRRRGVVHTGRAGRNPRGAGVKTVR